jgi:hypothetical protein
VYGQITPYWKPWQAAWVCSSTAVGRLPWKNSWQWPLFDTGEYDDKTKNFFGLDGWLRRLSHVAARH